MNEQLKIEIAMIDASRSALASFLTGTGAEVGAGDRPFPVPSNVRVLYGDIRDAGGLQAYFGDGVPSQVANGRALDAQTFAGIANEAFDFVISAHVLEHLFDPIGAIGQTIRVLKPGGRFILVIPDMRQTFDRLRPETPLEHVLRDYRDAGAGTRRQAYEDHVRYVHAYLVGTIPEAEVAENVERIMTAGMDVHVHAWSRTGAEEMVRHCETMFPMRVEAIHSVVNETQIVIRKQS